MKMQGKKLDARGIEYIVIPRPGEDIIFTAQSVLDMDEFENVVARPTPPIRTYKGGVQQAVLDDETYQQSLNDWASKHTDWLCLKSLEATEWLEWDTVDINNPETFKNWHEEMKEAGFSSAERLRVIQGVMTANGLNQERIDEARESFLAGLREAPEQESSSRSTEQSSTQSGEPAND